MKSYDLKLQTTIRINKWVITNEVAILCHNDRMSGENPQTLLWNEITYKESQNNKIISVNSNISLWLGFVKMLWPLFNYGIGERYFVKKITWSYKISKGADIR
jgi:hypothetical protein